MKLEFDSTEKPETLRAVAAFALMLAGDIDVPSVRDEMNTSATREMITPPNGPVPIVRKNSDPYPNGYASASPNIVPFPTAPPVPSMVSATVPVLPTAPFAQMNPIPPQSQSNATSAALTPAAPMSPAGVAAVASTAASAGPVEYDKAGLPWDARIHNKGRTKKRDGTWKLQKGLDPIIAQTVVAELAAKRVSVPQTDGMPPQSASVPQPVAQQMYPMQSSVSGQTTQAPAPYVMPPPPLPPAGGPLQPDPTAEARAAWAGAAPSQVPLPPFGTYSGPLNNNPVTAVAATTGYIPSGAVLVPPFPNGAPTPVVHQGQTSAPVFPPGQPGTVGGSNPSISGYKQLIDKLTAATQNKTLNPALVAPTVQRFGVPNMGMLGDPAYAGLLPAISQEFDRLIAGGAPGGP